jgi:hypothetical protein
VPDCALLHSLHPGQYSFLIPRAPAFLVRISLVPLSRTPTVIGITVIGEFTGTGGGITTGDTGLINTAGMCLSITIN